MKKIEISVSSFETFVKFKKLNDFDDFFRVDELKN